MHDMNARETGPDAWFADLRRAHAVSALAVIALCSVLFPFFAPSSVFFQLALVASLLLLISLPHASLDQYLALIAMQPLLGRFWPLGFVAFYGCVAVTVAFGWMFQPAATALAFAALGAIHYGLGDVEDRSRLRWLEIIARGVAPFALAVLFNPAELGAFVGWLILDVRLATIAIYDYAIPAAIVWQLVWAVVVIRQMWDAMANSSAQAGIVAAEMSILVLAFAVLPPLIAFVLYASLLHAPRHIIDLARRIPGATPLRALNRVLRAAIIPTALTVVMVTAAFFLVSDAPVPRSHILRIVIWIGTSFATPHMILTLLTVRRPS